MKNKKLVFGIHSVLAQCEHHPDAIIEIFLQKGLKQKNLNKLLHAAEQANVPVHHCDARTLDQKTQQANHQGVVALCHAPAVTTDLETLLEQVDASSLFLILDSIQDPHNLGACLRSADAAGVTAVIMPKDNAVGITPVVEKVACGAAQTVPVITVTNLVRAMKQLQEAGVWIMGTAITDEATSIFEADLTGPIAWALGAEGKGLRRLVQAQCDRCLMLPMHGTVQSLNVSVTAGICLYETIRQRRS